VKNLLLLRFLRPLAPLGWAVVRLVAGGLLMIHGWQKVSADDWPQGFAAGLEKMQVPLPEVGAWLSMTAELVGGALLALGFLTRPAGLLVAINMTVALLAAHRAQVVLLGTQAGGPAEYPLLLGAIGLGAMLAGGGPVSLDRLTFERSRAPSVPDARASYGLPPRA
jgi:putative oxidoreductase